MTCSPGYFYDIQTHTCKVCPIGSYQMDYGQNYCLACPGDTITDHDATTNVSECKSMYIVYQNKKTVSCNNRNTLYILVQTSSLTLVIQKAF